LPVPALFDISFFVAVLLLSCFYFYTVISMKFFFLRRLFSLLCERKQAARLSADQGVDEAARRLQGEKIRMVFLPGDWGTPQRAVSDRTLALLARLNSNSN
jgi:hypothetical protein